MKKIKIGNEIETLVDDDVFDRIKELRCWRTTPHKGKYVYAQIRLNGKTEYLHRVIMDAKRGHVVDHIDGNTLNNQRSNLRLLSQHGNQINTHRHRNKLGHSNIRMIGNRFQGRVKVFGKKISVGSYATLNEAIEAVCKFKKLLLANDEMRTSGEATP
jgi:hypothetical protein